MVFEKRNPEIIEEIRVPKLQLTTIIKETLKLE
jgi:hypothetical protein